MSNWSIISVNIITQAYPSYADNSILYGRNQGQPRFAWIDVEFLTKSIACVDRTWLFSSNLCRGASSALNFVGISLRSLKAENVCVCVMKFNSLLIPGWNPSSTFHITKAARTIVSLLLCILQNHKQQSTLSTVSVSLRSFEVTIWLCGVFAMSLVNLWYSNTYAGIFLQHDKYARWNIGTVLPTE